MGTSYFYSIYDRVAEKYGPPFTAVNDGVACRYTAHILREVYDRKDFGLVCFGEFDETVPTVYSMSVREVDLDAYYASLNVKEVSHE